MDTKLATQTIRIQQWTGIIQDCISSGMRVDDYCEQHGLTHHQYYYWLRKVKAHMLECEPQKLIEIKSPVSARMVSLASVPTERFCTEAMVSVGNLHISVNSGTPAELISTLFEVISHAV